MYLIIDRLLEEFYNFRMVTKWNNFFLKSE